MDDQEIEDQQKIHEAIEEFLREKGDLKEDQLLSGWVVCFETTSLGSSSAFSGHFYGPQEMTTWRALGLLEWSRRFSLHPDDGE